MTGGKQGLEADHEEIRGAWYLDLAGDLIFEIKRNIPQGKWETQAYGKN